jgi:hypothetical protein
MSFYSKSPYVVSFGTCLVKGAAADGIAQTQIEKTEKFSIRRNALFALWSAAYCGCAQVRHSDTAAGPVALSWHCTRARHYKIGRIAGFSQHQVGLTLSRSTTSSTLLSAVHSERRPAPRLRCKRQLPTLSSRLRCSASRFTTRASRQLRVMLAKGHWTASENTPQASKSSTSSQRWSGFRRICLHSLLSPHQCESRGQLQSQWAGCRLSQ